MAEVSGEVKDRFLRFVLKMVTSVGSALKSLGLSPVGDGQITVQTGAIKHPRMGRTAVPRPSVFLPCAQRLGRTAWAWSNIHPVIPSDFLAITLGITRA